MSIDCILEKGKQQNDWALPHYKKHNEVHVFLPRWWPDC